MVSADVLSDVERHNGHGNQLQGPDSDKAQKKKKKREKENKRKGKKKCDDGSCGSKKKKKLEKLKARCQVPKPSKKCKGLGF